MGTVTTTRLKRDHQPRRHITATNPSATPRTATLPSSTCHTFPQPPGGTDRAPGYSERRWKPPSTSMTWPVLKGSRSVAMASTARPTSSGWPQRRIGVRPSSRISRSYLLLDRPGHVGVDDARPDLVHVDPVLGQAGRVSLVIIAEAGLGQAVVAPVDTRGVGADRQTVTIFGAVDRPARTCSIIRRATSWVRKYGPLRLTPSTRSKDSSPASRMSARTVGATPALLTSRSSRPHAAYASATRRSPVGRRRRCRPVPRAPGRRPPRSPADASAAAPALLA